MKLNNLHVSIKSFIRPVLFMMLFVFGTGIATGANAHNLTCVVSTSSSLSDDGIINNVHITKDGYIAATNEVLLDRAIRLAISGNRDRLREFLLENPFVFYLRANLWAHIEHRTWPGKIKIKLKS